MRFPSCTPWRASGLLGRPSRTRWVAGALALAMVPLALAACEDPVEPAGSPDPLFHHNPDHLNADHERLWGENLQWVFVRPRPPGIGASAERVRVYQIAPVDENDPLSKEVPIPGVGTRGEVDQVTTAVPRGNRGAFRGIGETVPVLHPTWNGAECEVGPFGDDDRILWRIVTFPTPPNPACGETALVYAVDLEGDGECFQPLTSAERVEQAEAMGLVSFLFLPEPPWPFSAHPITEPGQGRTAVAAPACVNAG